MADSTVVEGQMAVHLWAKQKKTQKLHGSAEKWALFIACKSSYIHVTFISHMEVKVGWSPQGLLKHEAQGETPFWHVRNGLEITNSRQAWNKEIMDGNLVGTGQLCVISLFCHLQLYQERSDEGWSFQRKGRREITANGHGGVEPQPAWLLQPRYPAVGLKGSPCPGQQICICQIKDKMWFCRCFR